MKIEKLLLATNVGFCKTCFGLGADVVVVALFGTGGGTFVVDKGV